MYPLIGRLMHWGVWSFQAIRRLGWFVTRPQTVGVHGIPITPEGNIVLVTLSYARGWRLPGGGRKKGEDGQTAMLRELREEIGLTNYATVKLVADFSHRPDHRHGAASLFVIEGVEYTPKWSLEVKDVGEFPSNQLPAGTARITYELLALAANPLEDARSS